MSSVLPGFAYDIFISYRQKDNKGEKWVSEFVDALKDELESTFKEEISVYFDVNPHDGLLETHDVGASLKEKLNCLVFIPVISQTYCDPNSFAWKQEFVAFNKLAKQDLYGRDIRLAGGNVASRILPVKIHDLDAEDKALLENELGGILRPVEFIYTAAGVNRPLRANEDHPQDNLNKTYYRDQINKVANAIKEIIAAIKKHDQKDGEDSEIIGKAKPVSSRKKNPKIILASVAMLALLLLGLLFIPKLFKTSGPPEKSIAVLPFKNDSPDQENTYFINGIMEEILNHLQTIKDLRVISRTSVEQYRNKSKSIPEIAKELGVNYIVEGSGQKYGNTFRMRVQLIMAAKEHHLWGKSYEKEILVAKDIFSIQNQIAETIAGELEAVITPQEKQLMERMPTENLTAYDAYMKGQYYWRKFTQFDADTAMQYFELAKEKDPKYALAYAGISDVWTGRQILGTVSPEEGAPKAMAAVMKALELDSSSAEVHFSLAVARGMGAWDWHTAETEFKKTFRLNPNHAEAHSFYSHFLNYFGRKEEALAEIRLALQLDPNNPMIKAFYAVDLLFMNRNSDALAAFKEVLKADPTNPVALCAMPLALHFEGLPDEVLKIWKIYFTSTYKQVGHAFDKGFARGGYRGALQAEADTLALQSKTSYVNPTDIALLYAVLGNKARTLDMLEQGYRVHDPNMAYMMEPICSNLRDEPRFQDLCRKMNLPYK